jgi:hypothetical protein
VKKRRGKEEGERKMELFFAWTKELFSAEMLTAFHKTHRNKGFSAVVNM